MRTKLEAKEGLNAHSIWQSEGSLQNLVCCCVMSEYRMEHSVAFIVDVERRDKEESRFILFY